MCIFEREDNNGNDFIQLQLNSSSRVQDRYLAAVVETNVHSVLWESWLLILEQAELWNIEDTRSLQSRCSDFASNSDMSSSVILKFHSSIKPKPRAQIGTLSAFTATNSVF